MVTEKKYGSVQTFLQSGEQSFSFLAIEPHSCGCANDVSND